MNHIIFTIFAVCIISTFPLSASAQYMNDKDDNKVYLLVGGFTSHFEDRSGGREYNEVNNNLGLEYEAHIKDGWHLGATASYIRNSLDNDSVLLTVNGKKKWDLNKNWTTGVGIGIGAQNGYPSISDGRDKSEFVPVAYPFAEISYKRVGVYATCVPKIYESGFCFVGGKFRALDF